jgi:hypothetical protein
MLLLFVGDPAAAAATTLETVPVIRRRYVTPRACVHECTGMNRDVVRSNLAVLRSTTSVIRL